VKRAKGEQGARKKASQEQANQPGDEVRRVGVVAEEPHALDPSHHHVVARAWHIEVGVTGAWHLRGQRLECADAASPYLGGADMG